MLDLRDFLAKNGPAPTVNHRSNLHIHVRVPGLRDDLPMLKRVQSFIHLHMRNVLEVIQPLPKPLPQNINSPETYLGAVRRRKRRRVSHQALLTSTRLCGQLAADTVEEFFRREVPQSKGNP